MFISPLHWGYYSKQAVFWNSNLLVNTVRCLMSINSLWWTTLLWCKIPPLRAWLGDEKIGYSVIAHRVTAMLLCEMMVILIGSWGISCEMYVIDTSNKSVPGRMKCSRFFLLPVAQLSPWTNTITACCCEDCHPWLIHACHFISAVFPVIPGCHSVKDNAQGTGHLFEIMYKPECPVTSLLSDSCFIFNIQPQS